MVDDGVPNFDDAEALRLAAELEGHPDNVAPCLLGGFTIAWTEPSGARAVRLMPAPTVRPVVLIPDKRALTAEARAALPASVPHHDAAYNAGRAALLVHALTSEPAAAVPGDRGPAAPGIPGARNAGNGSARGAAAGKWCGSCGQWGGPERIGPSHRERPGGAVARTGRMVGQVTLAGSAGGAYGEARTRRWRRCCRRSTELITL